MWGFTVDDALIPVRYAHHLATGAGYRFDAHGPSTDGVTPLPWAVAPRAARGQRRRVTALVRAKVLGVVAWTLAGGGLGARVGAMSAARTSSPQRSSPWRLVRWRVAFPIGAWAASGMETGLATGARDDRRVAVGVGRPIRAGLAGSPQRFVRRWRSGPSRWRPGGGPGARERERRARRDGGAHAQAALAAALAPARSCSAPP